MKKIFLIIISALFIISCGSRNAVYTTSKPKTKVYTSSSSVNTRILNSKYSGSNSYLVENIIKSAKNYLGIPYKSAGTTSSGFDCSGLVGKVFLENKIQLPRKSEDQAKEGKSIGVSEIKPGDLLFFATSTVGKVNHVAIVNEIRDKGEITFIHSSTSKGVIISSLNEKYWNKAFLFARRVL